MEAYKIGSIVWFHGDEYKITTEPYVLWGATWQDAEGCGKTITVPTPQQQAENIGLLQAERAAMQAGFRGLRNPL